MQDKNNKVSHKIPSDKTEVLSFTTEFKTELLNFSHKLPSDKTEVLVYSDILDNKEEKKDKKEKKEEVKENKRVKKLFVFIGIVLLISVSFYAIDLSIMYNNLNKINDQEIIIQTQDNLDITSDSDILEIDVRNVPSYLYNYVDCLNKGLDQEKFSSKLNNNINNLNEYLNQFSSKAQLSYKELNTGFRLGYHENTKVYAASVTKAPLVNYIYLQADNGKVDLDRTLTYTRGYYSKGTGLLKNKPFNTSYSMRDLAKYSIIYSDNIAHHMLLNTVNKKDVSNYFGEKGAKNLFKTYDYFGNMTASDGIVYMTELYKYSLTNTENSNELLGYFKKANLNNIKIGTKKDVAHKYGWNNKFVNDMGIVFDDNPYIIVITSTLGDENWSNIFQEIAKRVDGIHENYWQELKTSCQKEIN